MALLLEQESFGEHTVLEVVPGQWESHWVRVEAAYLVRILQLHGVHASEGEPS
jgi:hypothetical protein